MPNDSPDPRPWQRVRTEERARNPYWSAHRDRVRLPNGGEHDYHFVRTPGSVLVVPLDAAAGRLLLVRQYRYLLGQAAVEFPGGGVKPGQQPLAAAQAELREETGYVAEQWQPLGWFNPCKGLLEERCHVYLAAGLTPDPQPLAGDDTEEIAVVWWSAAELDAAIHSGTFHDGMTLAAWALARTAVAAHVATR